MKAIASEKSPHYAAIYNTSAKIGKQKKDVENEEIQIYLSKLKELVPIMPKNRRLSKLEVIQYVIDYICDLQHALDNHPNINSAAVHSAAVMLCSNNNSKQSNSNPLVSLLHRKPLRVIPSNVDSPNSSCSGVETSPNEIVAGTTDKSVSC